MRPTHWLRACLALWLAVPALAQRNVAVEVPVAPAGAGGVFAAGPAGPVAAGPALLPSLQPLLAPGGVAKTQVAIVGAGAAGLALGAELKARGIDFVVLDKAELAGGSWQDMPTRLHVLSPWSQIELPRTPKNVARPVAPIGAKRYAQYLRDYAQHHELPVVTRTEVERIERTAQGGVTVFLRDGRRVEAAAAVNATGYFGKPFVPAYAGAAESRIPQLHFAAYKDAGQVSAKIGEGKKVLIVGKRLSAGQAMLELHDAGYAVALSARGKVEHLPPSPLDEWIERWLLPPVERVILALGLQDRVPTEVPMQGGRARGLIKTGAVALRPDIERFDGREVVFKDGAREAFDLVLYATGFRPALDHLGGAPKIERMQSLETPGLFFLGLAGLSSFRSRFIRGIRDDVPVLADRLQEFLGSRVARSPDALVATHFLASFNDTAVKALFSLWAAAELASKDAGHYVNLSMALFIVPYLLFSMPAGWLADRYSKRAILIGTRVIEVVAMSLAAAAFTTGSLPALLAVFPLMGAHTVLMAPSKYGLIPELVADHDISRTNGVLESAGFFALIAGTAAAGVLFAALAQPALVAGPVLVAGAIAGLVAALRVPKTAAAPKLAQAGSGWGMARPLWLATLGSAIFWGLAVMLQANIVLYAGSVLAAGSSALTAMLMTIALGAGIGCFAAGKLSGDKVRLSFVPFGALAFGAFMLDLSFFGAGSLARVLVDLFLMNVAAAFYVIPLDSFIQRHAPDASRGRVLGIGSLLNFAFVLAGTGAFYLLSTVADWPAAAIFRLMGAFGAAGGLGLAAVLRHRIFGQPSS
ncbi:MAG: MFS transporter [Elusimicrobia bacterium]|nr:MFS transporter [Elusimicrobiota bacterium]